MPAPHTCPVCTGRGIVPFDFYNLTPLHFRIVTATAEDPVPCKACGSAGIVWVGIEQLSDDPDDNVASAIGAQPYFGEEEAKIIQANLLKSTYGSTTTGVDLNLISSQLQPREVSAGSASPRQRSLVATMRAIPEEPIVPFTLSPDENEHKIHMDKFNQHGWAGQRGQYLNLRSMASGRITPGRAGPSR